MSCFLCQSQETQILPKIDLTTRVRCPVCGYYAISDLLVVANSIPDGQSYLLSALTRQANALGNCLTLTTTNISELIASAPNFATPLENLNRALLLIKQRQIRADEYVVFNLNTDYPLFFARDRNEVDYFLNVLAKQGLIEPPFTTLISEGGARLTPMGWQRAIELQKTMRESDQAFVAMSFTPEMTDAWQNGFKPALESAGFHPYRVDQEEHNEKIDDRIITEIRRSGLLVADFTGHRNGVYFEAGFAMGLGIPVIWTCRQTDIATAHFDTRQYNHVVWENPEEIKIKLALRIAATLPERHLKS
jgi:nucleoside 2-deoxyribosyltransferase